MTRPIWTAGTWLAAERARHRSLGGEVNQKAVRVPEQSARKHISAHTNAVLHLFSAFATKADGEVDTVYAQVCQKLSDYLQEPEASASLRKAWQHLSDREKNLIQGRVGKANTASLLSLSSETHPEIFFRDLLRLGRQNKEGRHSVLFQWVFSRLAQESQLFDIEIPPGLKRIATDEWQAVNGEGAFGLRFEHLTQSFFHEVMQPGPLLAMGVAAPLYSLSRYGTMARLLARPASLMTRGLGLRFTSSAIGLAPEVLGFWSVNRGYNYYFHPEHNQQNAKAITRELLGLTMTFGLFKFNGFLFGHGAEKLLQARALRGAATPFLLPASTVTKAASGLGMYSGIVSSHAIESKLGWRPQENLTQLLSRGLVTFTQLKTMGMLSHHLMGSRYAQWMQGIEVKAQALAAPRINWRGPWDNFNQNLGEILFPSALAIGPNGIRMPMPQDLAPLRPKAMQMSMGESGHGSNQAINGKAVTPEVRRRPMPLSVMKNALRILEDLSVSRTVRRKIVNELFDYPDLIKEVYARKLREEGVPEAQISGRSTELLNHFRYFHFSNVAEALYREVARFTYLVDAIRRHLPKVNPVEGKALEVLLESIEIKFWEIHREWCRAESIIGDYKGPAKNKRFTEKNYPIIRQGFDDFLARINDYTSSRPALIEFLSAWDGEITSREHSPSLRTVNWLDVKQRLIKLGERGEFNPRMVAQLIAWSEARVSNGNGKTRAQFQILYGHRNEFMTGLLEFIFKDGRSVADKKKIIDLLEMIVEREDIESIEHLAVRFTRYHAGAVHGKPALSPEGGAWVGYDKPLLQTLLKTSDFYRAHPKFTGPYFEFIEVTEEARRDTHTRLIQALDQRIKRFLTKGSAVQLVSRASVGNVILFVERPESVPALIGLTSVQKLGERQEFYHYARRLIAEVARAGKRLNHVSDTHQLELSIQVPRVRSNLIKAELAYWARDLIAENPQLTRIDLWIPKEGKAVRNSSDPTEFQKLTVTKASPGTAKIVAKLQEDLRATPKVGQLNRLYHLLKGTEIGGNVLAPSMGPLIQAQELYPNSPIIGKAIRKELAAYYDGMKSLGETKLSDFRRSDYERNLGELQTNWSLEYPLRNLEKKAPYRPISTFKASLGTRGHYRRVSRFFQAVLKRTVPWNRFAEVFDLDAVGFVGQDFHWQYNPRHPNVITIRGNIIKGEGKLPFSRDPKILQNGSEESPLLSGDFAEGYFELQVVRDPKNNEISLYVPRLSLPPEWQGSGVGTHFLERMIKLGKNLGAKRIKYLEVPTPGKVALLKMGGQIKSIAHWEMVRREFPYFLSSYIQQHQLTGFNLDLATSIQTPQQLVYANLNPRTKALELHPWFCNSEKTSPNYTSPEERALHQVGKQHLFSDRAWEWEISFDLNEGSPSMNTFWNYYAHRFKLRLGEKLQDAPAENTAPH